MTNRTLRVGLVGAGDNTRKRHIPGLRAVPGVELVGVVNRTSESTPSSTVVPAFCRKIWLRLKLANAAPLAEGITVLGPAPAPIAMVRGRHRWRLLVKANRDVNIQAFLREWLKNVKPRGALKLNVDVDPYNFL